MQVRFTRRSRDNDSQPADRDAVPVRVDLEPQTPEVRPSRGDKLGKNPCAHVRRWGPLPDGRAAVLYEDAATSPLEVD